ncbi:hypothetical protein DPMN_169222 [Dreissena polymorpha]|uniref:Uncharacterized protein n=1 Tax=Dreissena polymorpha TaxID=45954 RepID=A0A9D4J0C7_DREPO|nr:hypothetical protein DPMN_169222 [Dreissena polymorpha]
MNTKWITRKPRNIKLSEEIEEVSQFWSENSQPVNDKKKVKLYAAELSDTNIFRTDGQTDTLIQLIKATLPPTMNNRAILEGATSLTPPSIAFSNRTDSVASRVKHDPPIGSYVFQANIIIFKFIQDIIETNLLTKFHEDMPIHVASRDKCPAPGGHVFKAIKTILKLIQDIFGTNLLTKFHDDRKINVTSRVLTRKNAPSPWWPCFSTNHCMGINLLTEFHEDWTNNVASNDFTHVFQAKATIFELIQDIIRTNFLTKFHEDRKINVASRKNAPPPGGHVCQPTGIIIELVQDIIGMNLLTKFHKDWTINVASRVTHAPPLDSHVFQAKFHDDRKINVASRLFTMKNDPPPGGHVFQPTDIIFELDQDIIRINLLTKLHEDQTINVASIVKNAPPHGSHANLLTKFHKNWTIIAAYRELTRQIFTPHNAQRTTDDARRTKGDHKSSPLARCAQVS